MPKHKRGRLLAARYPMGHRMGQTMVPLMLIHDDEYKHFLKNVCQGIDIDEHGIILDRERFVNNLRVFKPGIASAIEQMGVSVLIQIWPEPLCFYQTSAM